MVSILYLAAPSDCFDATAVRFVLDILLFPVGWTAAVTVLTTCLGSVLSSIFAFISLKSATWPTLSYLSSSFPWYLGEMVIFNFLPWSS